MHIGTGDENDDHVDTGIRGLEAAQTAVPDCPAVALYGKALSDSVLHAWWDRWAGRAEFSSCINIGLHRIGKARSPVAPTPRLREWLI
eukprot:2555529-Lingulodinium_polyedra.AAC.1